MCLPIVPRSCNAIDGNEGSNYELNIIKHHGNSSQYGVHIKDIYNCACAMCIHSKTTHGVVVDFI
jgi:hypothetical protein